MVPMLLFGLFTEITWLPAVCFVIGFILVITEMFFPGFGLPGIAGIIFLFAGVLFLADTVLEAVIMIVAILVILAILLAVILRSASVGHLSKTVVLSDSLKRESGFRGTENLDHFLNKEGVALTILRPAGIVEIDGEKLDVVTQGEFIQKGEKVKVIKVEGRRIVVE